MQKSIIISVLGLLLFSCQKIDRDPTKKVIARVNDMYLYFEDIKHAIPPNVSKKDSLSLIQNYINTWATRELFMDQSRKNLTQKQLREFDDLVRDYKSTLYINAYKDAVIHKSIDMEITNEDLNTFYNENLKNFNLNEELVKLRYLHLPPDYNNTVATQKKLDRFNENDQEDLLNDKLEFLNFSLADSLWVSYSQVLSAIPVLETKEKSEVLKRGKYIQLKDSLGIYMMKIKDVLQKNEVAPMDYIKPTIKQIILNKRKRELIKNLEKDITKDAIKNKQFEIYN